MRRRSPVDANDRTYFFRLKFAVMNVTHLPSSVCIDDVMIW
jgi:hypothetical protein